MLRAIGFGLILIAVAMVFAPMTYMERKGRMVLAGMAVAAAVAMVIALLA